MWNSQFNLFISKAVKFAMLFIIIDITLGTLGEYLFFKQSTGKFARITYSLERADADILIIGSSHANRHFVPMVFENKLNMSCYNSGVQGQGILFLSVIEEIILARIKPKILVLNIDEEWLIKSAESYDRLVDLHPYYSKYPKNIKPILDLKSKYEHLKMVVKSYRLNSTIVHIVKYLLVPQIDQNGYNPLYGKMSPPDFTPQPVVTQNTETIKSDVDSNFVNAFNKVIKLAKSNNVELLFISSPTVEGTKSKNESSEMMNDIILKSGFPFLDFSDDKHFVSRYELFFDSDHLNNEGAILFSGLISDFINNRIISNKIEL